MHYVTRDLYAPGCHPGLLEGHCIVGVIPEVLSHFWESRSQSLTDPLEGRMGDGVQLRRQSM